jgi:predicted transcriptional regulator
MAFAITFSAPPEFAADLKAQAQAQDTTQSKILRRAFYEYVEKRRAQTEKAEAAAAA